MGQDEYIDWAPELTSAERDDRRFFQAAAAAGRSAADIAAAVQHATKALAAAEYVSGLVKEQAIFAMAVEGASVRQIADATAIPKSEVGRTLKRQKSCSGGTLKNYAAAAPVGSNHDELRMKIREAWGGIG
jgi:DNA-directed RNA polymerase specialized sigma24 family protein